MSYVDGRSFYERFGIVSDGRCEEGTRPRGGIESHHRRPCRENTDTHTHTKEKTETLRSEVESKIKKKKDGTTPYLTYVKEYVTGRQKKFVSSDKGVVM